MAQSLVSSISCQPTTSEDQPTYLETGYTYSDAGDISKPAITDFPDPAKTWNPDARVYYARRLKSPPNNTVVPLPEGFPSQIENTSLVWSGQDITPEQYIFHFSEAEIAEIESALKYFTGLNQPISSVDRSTFPLPSLGPRLKLLSNKLYGDSNGLGFFVLRGLNPDLYTAKENIILYAGISSYLSTHRGKQDEKNNMLLHLTDLTSSIAPDNLRQAPYSNVPQPFHTDTADLLSLYCLNPAFSGGRSILASSWKVYNELSSSHPAHIHTLSKCNWAFDTFGRSGASYTLRPLLHHLPKSGRVQLSFSRRPLTGSPVSPRTQGIPELTTEQSDALDTVHFTALAHAVYVLQQKGDLQYWNNFALVHAREGFRDRGADKRHLLRLWLRDEERREEWGEVPEVLRSTWLEAFGDVGEEVWPVVPQMDREFVVEQRRSSGFA
ncbi:hypothetical protein BZA77DRAFT_253974 [Pyronema omphalodes]|nr:hypothetical protein BZA77DRAFT_253974 [Pyronema omphalodes]